MPKASEKSNARRSRSFGGCGTCRRRHVKCDQVRPVCLTCKAIGATCEGFTAEIRWMSSKNGNDADQFDMTRNSLASRRHLYSEDDRERMSSSMTSSFQIGSVDASLSELDTRSKKEATSKDIAIGPFGVLSFQQPVAAEQSTEVRPLSSSEASIGTVVDEGLPTLETPLSIDSFLGLDDSLQWADLFGFGSDGMFVDNPILDSSLGAGNTDMLYSEPAYDQLLSAGDNVLANVQSSNHLVEPPPVANEDILNEAQMLLRHFKDNVYRRWSSMPVMVKSPWSSIILPEAVGTLAQLTFMQTETVSCAKKSNLYAMLGISAQHLSNTTSPDATHTPAYWAEFTKTVYTEAKQQLQKSLREELSGPCKARYKDQMTAIFSLLAVATIAGQPNDVRCYLIDCERLMRTRGLGKRVISRKCRFLHHMYTWYRILGESTYVLYEHCPSTASRELFPIAHPSSSAHHREQINGQGSRLDDFLRVELYQEDRDLDIQELKEPQVSLHDIHLEDSRENPDTMYADIYGISETWLSLLSQTTRLANKMDAVNACETRDAIVISALQRRAARLEDMICSFAAEFTPRSSAPRWAPNNHMHRALNSALVIFFYRRIRQVNSWILQSHVADVVTSLEAFDQSLSDKASEGPGTLWPAFVAGCEAATKEKRNSLLAWLDKAFATTGFRCYNTARELLIEVWRRKDEAVDTSSAGHRATRSNGRPAQSSITWVEICREQKTWLMAF